MENQFIQFIKKEGRILAVSLVVGFLIAGYIAGTKAYSETIQSGIAGSVVRFHVLANSDSEEDQALKLKVRDAVLEDMQDALNTSSSVEETQMILEKNMNRIRKTAEKTIEKQGKSYPVSVSLSEDLFPTKQYGDMRFPAGYYQALRIEIGEAEGQNWWCIMYPPLCFVDVTQKETTEETKEEFKNILTEEEYQIVVLENQEVNAKIKFKIVEWWQELKLSQDQGRPVSLQR